VKPEQQSRLSVLHLLVGTTCIALYLAISRHIRIEAQSAADPSTAIWVLWSIGTGAALSGLILLVSRRWQEERFPVHPGEALLVVMSVDAWIDLSVHSLMALYLLVTQSSLNAAVQLWYAAPFYLQTIVMAVLYFVTARRLESPRWRSVFWFSGTAYLLYPFCCNQTIPMAISLTSNLILIFVVVSDHQEGARYPWTHWLGVGLKLWFTPLIAAWLVYYLLVFSGR
jgi:hypothetical protein